MRGVLRREYWVLSTEKGSQTSQCSHRGFSTKYSVLRTSGYAGVAQLVEHQPSKLRVAGSSPVARLPDGTGHDVARVAQLVERILGKDEVRGSIPRASLRNAVPTPPLENRTSTPWPKRNLSGPSRM